MSDYALNGSMGSEQDRIRELMQHLLESVPDGLAALAVSRDNAGVIFQPRPVHPKSAVFGIHYDGCVDVSFGRGTTFELPYESELPKHADFQKTLQWTRAMGQAVISGEGSECVGFLGIQGTIHLHGKPFRVTNFFHFHLFPRRVRCAPFCPAQASADEHSRPTPL